MKTQTEKRTELLEKIKSDTNLIDISTVVDLFANGLQTVLDKTEAGKNLKRKLTKEDLTSFTNGLVLSYVTSIYASASKDETQLKKRMNEINYATHDLLVGEVIYKKEADA